MYKIYNKRMRVEDLRFKNMIQLNSFKITELNNSKMEFQIQTLKLILCSISNLVI